MFKCPYCNKNFTRVFSLKTHIKKVHLQHNIYCPFCNEKFKSILLLQTHLLSKNDDFHRNLFYLITRGYKNFIDKKLLMKSNQNLIKSDNDEQNDEQSSLYNQNDKITIGYKCLYCDKEMKTIAQLKTHIKKNHLRYNLYCPICKEEFKSYLSFKIHLRTENDDYHQKLLYLTTKKCIKKEDRELLFSQRKNNKKHNKIIIGYKCPFCEHRSLRIVNLYWHVTLTHDTNPIKCPYCNYIAINLSDLETHSQLQKDIKHLALYKLLSRSYKEKRIKKIFMIK